MRHMVDLQRTGVARTFDWPLHEVARVIRIGTAGWALPRGVQDRFPGDDAHLVRYARVLGAAEINSTFHRSHRLSTYARWAASVPPGFRFSAKMPKTITHERRLAGASTLLDAFADEVAPLGPSLGCVLVQLPPSLAFERPVAERFFGQVRRRFSCALAVEPRHASWFAAGPAALLDAQRIARVAADPARVPQAAVPGGWPKAAYWRWHGSPQVYRSSYGDDMLRRLARRLVEAQADDVWCILDNTTLGAAAANALTLQALVDASVASR